MKHHQEHGQAHAHQGHSQHHSPYRRLLVMMILSFLTMYILMYAMVDRLDNVYPSFNQAYMAALMASPMLGIELALMSSMYPNKKLNALLLLGSVLAGLLFFSLIRQQTAIADGQFLKSMIPHHSGAILMCREASLQDPEIKALCANIISGQQTEIEQMKGLLSKK